MRLGNMVRELGQGLSRTDADASWHTCPPVDCSTHIACELDPFGRPDVGEVEEALIDGVHLDARGEASVHLVHACADVAIERVVGGVDPNALIAAELADLEPGIAHLDADGLRLGRTRDRTTVVVA